MVFYKDKTPQIEVVCHKCKRWDPWATAADLLFSLAVCVCLCGLTWEAFRMDVRTDIMQKQLSAIDERLAQNSRVCPMGYPGTRRDHNQGPAGPTAGAPATPTLRTLVLADLPGILSRQINES